MIRSGYHREWDALLATSRERAERAGELGRLARCLAPMRAVVAAFGVSFAEAAESLRKTAHAIERRR